MFSKLCILTLTTTEELDCAFFKLAQFHGLEPEMVALGLNQSELPATLQQFDNRTRILAFSSKALQILKAHNWFSALLAETSFALVYGFWNNGANSTELAWLTGNAITELIPLPEGTKTVIVNPHADLKAFAVSGLCYSESHSRLLAFKMNVPYKKVETYISVNDLPYLVAIPHGKCKLFLLAEESFIDIDTVLTPESSLRPWYAQLIALTIFLRVTYGSRCWTAPLTPANFIIDDPHLVKQYGFLHYETLLADLQRSRSALTVAFIPYNFKRSNPKTVALARRCLDRFSIAVHGCDHTGGEFASLDAKWLESTAGCAMQRMEHHQQLTGMPFDNVMVFPQGRFSTKAIIALKRCGYAAAANSGAWPVDYNENPLTIRDLLSVAVTRYESFPIFIRRYPRDIFDYAFDALFQKPILGVEHHAYFRHGSGPFLSVIEKLSALPTSLAWMPLGQAVEQSCLVRSTGDGQCALKHFAPVLRFRNLTPKSLSLQIEKAEQDGTVEAVFVNGQKVDFEIRSGILKYSAQLGADETLHATIAYPLHPRLARKTNLKYHLSTSVRRVLSEVRDNYFARNNRVLIFAEKAKKLLISRKPPRDTYKSR